MANGAVWGIDIGQCALKALQCRFQPDAGRVLAEGFDYIEYPKILSQPGSNAAELVGAALKQFLSRNSVTGDRVAISVGGHTGLVRFIRLPPVEAKKIPDIVRYEARQQIPFDLNDVVWDYQRMGGGSEEEGFALDAEIGLFAMKRDAVFRALEPLQAAGIEIDVVQLMPLALYNFVLFDQMPELPPVDEYDLDEPPQSVVIFSLGTDATDLVITNGYRVWQRSIPLGGSHFTKALTKDLKLTFAKAEHLKRNATAAADPKAVFQAMRPVFGELLTELQRSISYFCNLDRTAKIGRIIGLGNAMKLPGLRRYLSQSLGYEVERLDSFAKLTGSSVIAAPAFEGNLLSFGVCYGLAVQALGKSGVHTNLLPREITRARLIRRKKPWAVASLAALLSGCAVSFGIYSHALARVQQPDWDKATATANQVASEAASYIDKRTVAEKSYKSIDEVGRHLVHNVERRVEWLEMLRAVTACLPHDDLDKPRPAEIGKRQELHITNLECQEVTDLSQWFAAVKEKYQEQGKELAEYAAKTAPRPAPAADVKGGPPAAKPAPSHLDLPGIERKPTSAAGGAAASPVQPAAQGPTGKGRIISLSGYHYHNFDPKLDVNLEAARRKEEVERMVHDTSLSAGDFVVETLIKNLRDGKVLLPGPNGKPQEVSLRELGISYPVLISASQPEVVQLTNPNVSIDDTGPGQPTPILSGQGFQFGFGRHSAGQSGPAARQPGINPAPPKNTVRVVRCHFLVHFCWQATTPSGRQATKGQEGTILPTLGR